jgi:hypothetical protein
MDEAAERIVGNGGFCGGILSGMNTAFATITADTPPDLIYTDIDDLNMFVYTGVAEWTSSTASAT